MKSAVIYCRVSSEKQATEGHGLTSQESTCRKYAAENEFEVLNVFTDDSTGGGDFWKRPGITKLLAFLQDQDENIAVIFDDLKRFARDTRFHLQLRQELSSRNAYPRCPNFRFDETPEGEFVETVIAATAELERKQNRRQVISRMKARLEAGHWVFSPPLGYRFARVQGERRVIPDPVTAEHVQRALVDFSTGKFATQAAVLDYLRANKCSSRFSTSAHYSRQAIRRLLTNEFYTGWCVCKKWNIRIRGIHEPLITEEALQQILQRLALLPGAASQRRVKEEFPLRGFVQCAECRRFLTAGWSRGRNARYPYYRCQTPGCIGSVRKNHLEELYASQLKDARPKESALTLFERVLKDLVKSRHLLQKQQVMEKKRRFGEIDEEVNTFVDIIGRSPGSAVQKIYEEKIIALQDEKARLEASKSQEVILDFEPVLRKGREFLRDPMGSWKSGNFKRRQAIQHLAFDTPVQYDSKEPVCTAEYSLLYRLLGASEGGESSLVDSILTNLNPVAEEFKKWIQILKRYEI